MENQSQQQVQDNKQIRLDEQELNYWFKEFGITKEEILEELEKGGTSTEAVEKFVKRTALVA